MKKILSNYIGFGFLMLIIFNLVLFVISLVFGFEDNGQGPTLIPAIFFTIVMGLITSLMIKRFKPKSLNEAIKYSISWTSIVLILTIITTIPNETFNIFFGHWFNWLPFIMMYISPLFIKYNK